MSLHDDGHPASLLCRVFGVARSSLYYRPRDDRDGPVREALVRLAGQWPTYGYRRLAAMLMREAFVVGDNRVLRLVN